jgi:hypothetical protein
MAVHLLNLSALRAEGEDFAIEMDVEVIAGGSETPPPQRLTAFVTKELQ